MKNKHPVHIIVFFLRGVTSNDDVMALYIFLHVLRLNTEAYIKCFKEVVPTRIERVVSERTNV